MSSGPLRQTTSKGGTWLHRGDTGAALQHRHRGLSRACSDLEDVRARPESAPLDQEVEDPVRISGTGVVRIGDAVELLGQLRGAIEDVSLRIRLGHR